jgi:hypothetical protein
MSFNTLIGYLVIAASTTLGSFILFVVLDLGAAVILAARAHTFDVHRLGDFLSAQFATRKFLGVLGLAAAAAGTAFASTLSQGSITEAALQGIAQVALAAATAGAATMLASIIADFMSKVAEVFGAAPTPSPAPTDPIPVVVVPPPTPPTVPAPTP